MAVFSPTPTTTLLSAVTSGTSQWVDVSQVQRISVTFTSAGTTSGGTLLIEETDDPSSTATASQMTSVAASTFSGTAKATYHLVNAASQWMRVRISSAITGGGTVTVTFSGV
jgi:hypothetical protein